MAFLLKTIMSRTIGLKRNSISVMAVQRMSGFSDHVPPTNFQKKILVWTKFYPDAASVPATVTRGQLKKSIDLFRIRVNILMLVFVVGASAAMIYRGRRLRREGDTAHKRGLDMVQELKEQNKK